MIAFGSEVSRLQAPTADQAALRTAIDGIAVGGDTAFYDAVYAALEDLRSASGRRIVLALTDGEDNESTRDPQEAIDLARSEGIAIYTIGLGTSFGSRRTLDEMALETAGEFHQTPTASELSALYGRIAEEVQNEYVLGYDSPVPELDGTTREVQVTIRRTGGNLATRGSYSVSGILSSTLNLGLFFPLLAGLSLLLVALLFAPGLLGRLRSPRAAEMAPMPAAGMPAAPAPAPQAHAPTPAAGYQPCGHCGVSMRVGAKFCPSCGQQQTAAPAPSPAAAACRQCGAEMRPGATFCGRCGARA